MQAKANADDGADSKRCLSNEAVGFLLLLLFRCVLVLLQAASRANAADNGRRIGTVGGGVLGVCGNS